MKSSQIFASLLLLAGSVVNASVLPVRTEVVSDDVDVHHLPQVLVQDDRQKQFKIPGPRYQLHDGNPVLQEPSVVVYESESSSSLSPVAVEMFVMSKCPDAAYCISNLILPLMANLSSTGMISLKPTYIGTPDDSNGGTACMHGPDECAGDILELCAYELYKPDPKLWLGFIYCLGKDYKQIPDDEFVHGCAKEHGLDYTKLSNCATSEEMSGGIELLRTSARRAIQLEIKTSCTITINQVSRCVRDGGEWKNCDGGHEVADLRRDIVKAYEDSKKRQGDGKKDEDD